MRGQVNKPGKLQKSTVTTRETVWETKVRKWKIQGQAGIRAIKGKVKKIV
jgi:hypothetical protein